MSPTRFIAPILLTLGVSSCAFILDFDELQEGSGGTSAGGSAGSGGKSTGVGGSSGGNASGGIGGAGDVGGGGGMPEQGIPLDQAAGVLADALCTKIETCVGPQLSAILFQEEDCRENLTHVLENSVVANIAISEENGVLEYDATGLPVCIQAFDALDCEDVNITFPEECKQAIGSPLKEGDPCQHSLECEGSLYCSQGTCPGTCTAPLAEGDACTADDTCAAGLTCFMDECAPLGAEGDECGADVLPECLLGLFCVGADKDNMTPGTCYPGIDLFSANEGQACNFFGQTPTLCKEGSCPLLSLTPECLPQADADGDCQAFTLPDMCPEGQSCQSGACTDLPKNGEACVAASAGKGACRAGLRCVGGQCRPIVDNGVPCANDAECYSGFCGDTECEAPRCPD